MTERSDLNLLSDFIESNDQASFTCLVHRHGALVMGVCYRILGNTQDAQDAAQSTFIQLAIKAKKLDSKDTLAPWLYNVARQKSLDSLKARNRRAVRQQKEWEFTMDEKHAFPVRNIEEIELGRAIDAVVGELPRIYRDVIVLYYFQDKTQGEIADSLGCNISTISMRLNRAKDKLRNKLVERGLTAGALSILASGGLQAATPQLPANFAAQTFGLAIKAVQGSETALPIREFLPSRGVSLVGGVAAACAMVIFLLNSNQEMSQPVSPPEVVSNTHAPAPAAKQTEVVEVVARAPFDLASSTASYYEPVHEELRQFIISFPEKINTLRNENGETLLNVASRHCNYVGAFLLLYHGADPNISDYDGNTPLMHPVDEYCSDSELIRDMLVLKGADIRASNHQGDTPLIRAVEANRYNHAEFLLWMRAQLRPSSAPLNRHPKQLAHALGHGKLARMLEAVESTSSSSSLDPVKSILPDYIQKSLIESTVQGNLARLEEVIANGGNINLQDSNGRTLLHTSMRKPGLADVSTYLIYLGADVNAQDRRGLTPFMTTYGWRGFDADRRRYMLVLAGADLSTEKNDGHSAVSYAAEKANRHALMLAIWAGTSLSKTSNFGTPMHIASKAGHQKIVELLKTYGVDEKPYSNQDPAWKLHTAARAGDLETLSELLRSGVPVDLPDAEGYSPLINAIRSPRVDSARALLAAGADPNYQRPSSMKNSLHYAILWNGRDTQEFFGELLQAGADPNQSDKNRQTPLILSCKGRGGELQKQIPQLILAGADINHRDRYGKSALDYAMKEPSDILATYLIEMGAEQ